MIAKTYKYSLLIIISISSLFFYLKTNISITEDVLIYEKEDNDSLKNSVALNNLVLNHEQSISILNKLFTHGIAYQLGEQIQFKIPFDLHGFDCGVPDCYTTQLSFEIPAIFPIEFPYKFKYSLKEFGCVDELIESKGIFRLVDHKNNIVSYYSKDAKSNLIIKLDENVLYYFTDVELNEINLKVLESQLDSIINEKSNIPFPYQLSILIK